ncbi:MAG: leucine--tRNA ligase [Candidatus Pacearchaeota archaeon]|nr:MAG: leucine--tRNA ligase [Candidatus Pacearchaeota archaeon]
MARFNFQAIEKKWQQEWEKKKIFVVSEKKGKKKFYVLEMFPYPSAYGLHMGHAFNYTIGDIYARFMRMQGYNVLYPMGYDSLGLPAENAAIKEKIHPKKYTDRAISNFIKQQKGLGISYDWSRLVMTHDLSYYKWDQWIFLQMFKKGIAYRKKAPVNYCPRCKTVLANEQVINGKCWRHEDTEVEIKQLEQWFFKITKYASELYDKIDKLKDWPEDIKLMQKYWIGKSHGVDIDFEIEDKDINCVVVHGVNKKDKEKLARGEPPQNERHWIPWIKKQLEKKGIKTEAPLMPNNWNPKYNDWKKEFKNLNINENSVLIGHSGGGGFLIRWLGETKKRIKKLILIAPAIAYAKEKTPFEDLLRFKIDNKIKENIGEIIIFVSNNENESIRKSVRIISEKLDVPPTTLKDKGHFLEKHMGTQEFPELLKEVISRKKWPIFTTRADTIFGVTFMVISAQHPELPELVKGTKQEKEVMSFVSKLRGIKQEDIDKMDKEGVFIGKYAINPINNEKVPVYVGNFVLAEYGSGMVMAVPAHDQRDFEFAKKYKIPIRVVIQPKKDKKLSEKTMKQAYVDYGILVNSGKFNKMTSEKAIIEISKSLQQKNKGKHTIQYKLKDWLISRQRYWGTPIPIIYCDKCGIVPVPEKDLPIKLPEKVKFGKGNPLETVKTWIKVKCPKCKKDAKRETDTMDTFVNSSWYFLRYCDPKNKNKIFDKKKVKYWMPIDQYIGGKEHATGHLIYFRFYTKFLRDLGLLNIDEPTLKLFNQGVLHGPDGRKMSKSYGNVVLPEEVSKKYGIDTARLFLVSMASPDKDLKWGDKGVEGSLRFINRVMGYFTKLKFGKSDPRLESKLNKTIKEVTQDIKEFRYNLAVIKIRKLFDYFTEIDKKTAEAFLKMLHPFCPHITEELWHQWNKTFISLESWPKYNEKKINLAFEKEEEIQEKLKQDIRQIVKILGTRPKGIYVYVIPKELKVYNPKELEKEFNCKVDFQTSNKITYDPKKKAKKAKPGKPAIYIE